MNRGLWRFGCGVAATLLAGAGCGHDERVASLESRVSALEGSLGLASPAGSASSPGERLPELEKRVARIEEAEKQLAALDQRLAALESGSLRVTKRRITLDKSGNGVCADIGKVCLGVLPEISNKTLGGQSNAFCGYSIAQCDSTVKRRKGCLPGYDYALTPVTIRRAPDAKGFDCTDSGNALCLDVPFYDNALCL